MRASEKTDAISPAFVAAQEQLRNPKPDAKGQVRGRQDYVYLSLPALLEYVRKEFGRKGLAFSQDVSGDSTGILVKTVILHLSGQWFELGPAFIPATGGPQDWGSAITYARRYSLAAAVGLAADEDDDAARVTRPASKKQGAGTSATGAKPEETAVAEIGREGDAGDSTEGGGDTPGDGAVTPRENVQTPGSPSRRRCLHTEGIKTITKETGGAIDVCVQCGTVVVA
jgi:hypothetical protein